MPNELRSLDPFGIYPDRASQINGLGGAHKSDDLSYAFFSPYVPASSGRARISARFSELKSTAGSLDLIVRVLPRGSMIHAREVVRRRFNLKAAPTNLSVDFEFVTFAGAAYALAGEVTPGTVAQAGSLALIWDAEGETGTPDFLPTPSFSAPDRPLLKLEPPSLEAPVSQMCTADQFEEPAFSLWTSRMGEAVTRHRKQWEFVFILRALDYYGALRPGATGLGFGVGKEPLPAVFAGMGIDVLATDLPETHSDVRFWNDTNQHVATAGDLWRSTLCGNDAFEKHVEYRPVDMTTIPRDLTGFDFTWSSCAFEHLGSIKAGLDFVEQSVECLRPGGIAVHTTELNLTSDDVTIDNSVTVLFRRRDMIELALRLIARGHHVAPLCFHFGNKKVDQYVDLPPYCDDIHLRIAFGSFATTSFGLVVRRGNTP